VNKKNFYIITAFLILLIVAVNAYFYLQFSSVPIYVIFDQGNRLSTQTTTTEIIPQRIIETKCNDNSDCMWEITNCCSENAGAKWECVNGKTFVAGCPKNVLCPQFVSHKPTAACVCQQRSCTSE